jgi:hypothetical protein
MSRFGPEPEPDPSLAAEQRVKKGIRSGTCRLEGLKLLEMPRSLFTVDITKQMQLKEMYLDNNQLVRLPDDIGKLFNLYELRLMNNKLETLPPSIGALTNLQLLFLRNNVITSLPGCGPPRPNTYTEHPCVTPPERAQRNRQLPVDEGAAAVDEPDRRAPRTDRPPHQPHRAPCPAPPRASPRAPARPLQTQTRA